MIVTDDRFDITNLAQQVLPGDSDLVEVGMANYRKVAMCDNLKAVYVDTLDGNWGNIYYRLRNALDRAAIGGAKRAVVQFGCQSGDNLTTMTINAVLEIIRSYSPHITIDWGVQNGVHLDNNERYLFAVFGG
ncbi:MAG: hypothetical protein IJW88_04490 [Alistipes sp.]|nr:hypothetical protein [Alistipes sp.]